MPTQIKPLTGVRGLAALWVVFLHVNTVHQHVLHGALDTIVSHGYLAVDLFFVLSGFVMTLSYQQLFESGLSLRHYATFLIRRLARIYPLYFVTTLLIVALAVSGIDHHHLSTNGLGRIVFLNLTLVDAWGLAGSINGPAWSISTEFAAYLVFPLLLPALTKSSRSAAFGAFAASFAAIVFVATSAVPQHHMHRGGPLDVYWAGSGLPLVRCIAEFSIGILTFRLATNSWVQTWAKRPYVAFPVAATIAGLLTIAGSDVFVVALFPILILLLACGTNHVSNVFGSRIMLFTGEISYAVYLLQWPMLRIQLLMQTWLAARVDLSIAEIASIVVFLSLLVVASWLVYVRFEKPCRRWGRDLERFAGLDERRLVVGSEGAGAGLLSGHPL